MNDVPHRSDAWVQWAVLLLTILGAVWTMGGRLARIEQSLKDNGTQVDAQQQEIVRLQDEVLSLTRRIK